MHIVNTTAGTAANVLEQPAFQRKKLGELQAINITLKQKIASEYSRSLRLGPRQGFALLLAFAADSIVFAGFAALESLGVKIYSDWIEYIMLVSVLVLTYKLVNRYSKKPWTYDEQLYAQLTRYEPVDAEAYRMLQKCVRATRLEAYLVSGWLQKEHRAIALASGQNIVSNKVIVDTFLDKKV